jgi:hypothetical protein
VRVGERRCNAPRHRDTDGEDGMRADTKMQAAYREGINTTARSQLPGRNPRGAVGTHFDFHAQVIHNTGRRGEREGKVEHLVQVCREDAPAPVPEQLLEHGARNRRAGARFGACSCIAAIHVVRKARRRGVRPAFRFLASCDSSPLGVKKTSWREIPRSIHLVPI